MAATFTQKPDVKEVTLPDWWACPITGLRVPKDPVANLRYRVALFNAADEDMQLRDDLYTACSKSVLFFVNAFCYTLRVFESDMEKEQQQAEHAVIPYLTWPIQDDHILAIEKAIDVGKDLATTKSRDMGATWDHVVEYAHRFIFKDEESHLWISRKEDAVDSLDGLPREYPHGSLADPGTMFGKSDFVLSKLPEWMLPRIMRKKLHLINLDRKNRIVGESANATAGSSNRVKSIFLDEMAKMAEGESIKRSTRDVSKCRLPCSTHDGAGTAFAKWVTSGTIPVFQMMWWSHPEKSKGLYVAQDDLGRYKIRSPWYDHEASIRSPKEMAIEIDADPIGSGDMFFETHVIEEHRKLFAKPPIRTMRIQFMPKISDSQIPDACIKRDTKAIDIRGKGPWQVWTRLMSGRPDQTKTFTVSCDISKGMGASNSVINITSNEDKEKILTFVDANTPPYELAKLAVAACIWAGGRNRYPLLIWENNGDPGFDFGRQVTKVLQYPNVYFDRVPGTLSEKRGKRWGWRSSPEKKATAMGLLRRAYAHGGYINHDEAALDEALTYINFPDGSLGPAELVEENASARKTHGDRVIADMLAVVGMDEGPKKSRRAETSAPKRSPGYRFEQWKRNKKRKQQSDRFDFRVGHDYAI
jgi:hypothetical protein